jgi:hypothetical protein
MALAYSLNANAWFFVFLPGSVTGKIADAITGAEGDICVSSSAIVGETFNSANGNVATIKSLSGTSSRCKQPELPIRAKVEFKMSSTFSSKAGINLPDGYKPKGITDLQRFNGMLLIALNSLNDTGVAVTTVKHDVISDMDTYVNNVRVKSLDSLDEPEQSATEELMIKGLKAWRYETKGKLKNLFGTRYTYVMTIIQGDNEVLALNSWCKTNEYEKYKDEIEGIAFGVEGISSKEAAN